MDNATVSSLYCIALYDNYIALNDKVQKYTPVRSKFKSVSERRKSVTTGRTNERTDSRSPIYPNLFLADVYKSYQE
jgi:hypothetical protein